MNILIIGSGGREHCIAWKIHQDSGANKVFAIPGNPGIAQIGQCRNMVIDSSGFRQIADFARENNIDFTIVGPEVPLVEGIVDCFQSLGLRIFGPDRKAASLEGSKIFTKNLCEKYEIPTAESIKFSRSEYESAVKHINNLKEDNFPIVIKVDGLAAGKGVIISSTRKQAIEAVNDCFIKDIFGSSGDYLLIEQFISGYEVSILNLCDGKDIVPMVLAQDYKKIFDNDLGKNTGGMGSYSPVPFVDEKLYRKILDDIIYPTYDALLKEGIEYRGILYGGIIISKGQPFLLEYNCRFGDPETQAILPRLNDDLAEILISCESGKLGKRKLNWDKSKCICVVVASRGYPESSSRGDLIEGLDTLNLEKGFSDILVFHAGTKSEDGRIFTNGGRVLDVVSKSSTFMKARKHVYDALSKISFDGMQYRKDIAARVEEF